jgi:copper(I)-binding protein
VKILSRKLLISSLAAALAMAMPGSISTYAAGECREMICAEQGWTRATPSAQTAAIYFSVINQGDAADILVKASTPVAAAGARMDHPHNGKC